ncbi:hypothetical protein [Paenibacillus aceris]|uniref:Uncharacterized protein n=1 Tax=Paenibacillus aceris TaxID=869555 RepID=A0ABS4I4X2_9BACL|nr:hypothetical protein [Paenibacillus aceris]MBP1965967.1 hypothetical protein [Paenibacillus aceris]
MKMKDFGSPAIENKCFTILDALSFADYGKKQEISLSTAFYKDC